MQTTYVSKHRDTSDADSAADVSLLGLVHH